jgi:2-polyprenyl-3-methyl-5-hydroxy-6-metoxy-1,4-benzoquinol methylase
LDKNLVAYYAARAKEYEKIYDKPERQGEIGDVTTLLQNLFPGKEVLEIACGTGYWTERIAKVAASVLATDINEPVIEIAKSKTYEKGNVTFGVADMYTYKTREFENLFGGFIWSHIKLEELDKFIDTANSLVKPGGIVVFADNNYIDGSSSSISSTDELGNTYQTRILENGETFSVIKNFPTEETFKKALEGKAERIKFISLKYYWLVIYHKK